jgi:hypothetical protein
MRPNRTLPLVLLAALVLATGILASCTGDGEAEAADPSATPTSTVAPDGGASLPPEGPGGGARYELSNGEVTARLVLRGARAQLQVVNRSGNEIGRPAVYALHAVDGRRIPGRVPDAAPIPDGETVRLQVEFPEGFGPQQVGLVALVIGGDEYGAFIPQG